MANRTVSVALVADVGQYQSAMVKAASSTKAVGDNATTAGSKAQRGFQAAGQGARLLQAALVGGVALGLKSVIDASSDAEQSIGGVQAVFKGYADEVIASSNEADRALGLSANSYRELATIIGSQMKNAGIPMGRLAEQTQDIIQIGADLAAQFGGSTQDAVDALSSAFRGEMDPIERYGISLNQAALKAKALEMGLDASGPTLSQNTRVMASLALITQQSADAQGAFARESDTAAGRAQRAAAQWENLKVAVGDRLLPAWSALVDVLGTKVIPTLGHVLDVGGDVAGFMGDHKEIVLALAAALGIQLAGGITAVTVAFNRMILTPVVLGLNTVLGVVLNMPGAFAAARVAVAGFLASVAPLAAVAAIVYGVTKTLEIAHAAGNARKEIAGMWDAVNDSRGAAQLDGLNSVVDQLQSKVAELKHNLSDDGAWETTILGAWLTGAEADRQALEEYEKALDRAKAKQDRAAATTNDLAQAFGTSRTQVLALAEKYDIDLSRGLESVREKFGSAAAAAKMAGEGLVSVGNTAGMTEQQIEAATDAQKKWLQSLQQIGAGFVEPLGIYQGLLQEKEAAERTSAEATAASTKSSKDSWEDYAKDVSVSLDEYADKLQEQLDAQDNWRKNIGEITRRGGIDVGQAIAAMGEDGVQLAAKMADGTDAEFKRMAALLIRDAKAGGAGATEALDQAMKVMAAIGAAGGKATATSIAQQLGLGVGQVAAIAAQYGVKLATGVNPLLTALGHPPVRPPNNGAAVRGFYDGGFTGHGGKYEYAGPVHKGEVVWSQEDVAAHGGPKRVEALRRARGYASGGYVSAADVPRPPSTAPYREPISTAGDATMGKEYDEVRKWLTDTVSVGPSAAAGVQKWLPVVLQSLAMMGQPASLAQTVLRRMNQESGGNPTIVNKWDSNWKRGTPSVGLMQVIGPTYSAYKDARRNVGPYLYGTSVDPLANILASEHYALARYGSLSAAYNKAGGYANGGKTPVGDPFWVGEQGPELMWSTREKYVSSAQKSREFSGSGAHATVVKVASPAPQVTVHFHVDGEEFRGMTRTEIDAKLGEVADAVHYAGAV